MQIISRVISLAAEIEFVIECLPLNPAFSFDG